MAENKTKATDASFGDYLAAIDDKARREDCEALVDLMAKATKQPRPARRVGGDCDFLRIRASVNCDHERHDRFRAPRQPRECRFVSPPSGH
jgi:hypothetical protein